MSNVLENRYEFVYLFDVENGNPNGDPDADNMPRIDPETSHGLVTDVCLKRKIRNFVTAFKPEDSTQSYDIFVSEKAVLNKHIEEAHEDEEIKKALEELKKRKNKKSFDNYVKEQSIENLAKEWICRRYYDVRTFGAVLSTGNKPSGQVTGPVQFNFARSIEPITPLLISITRMAVTSVKEAEEQKGINRKMGRKHIVPYALYRAEGYISANLAQKTGFTEDDLALLWESLRMMFDHDRSAARGKMSARKLIAFRHDSKIGNAPAQSLFELVDIKRAADDDTPARSYGDYSVTINRDGVPDGVELMELL